MNCFSNALINVNVDVYTILSHKVIETKKHAAITPTAKMILCSFNWIVHDSKKNPFFCNNIQHSSINIIYFIHVSIILFLKIVCVFFSLSIFCQIVYGNKNRQFVHMARMMKNIQSLAQMTRLNRFKFKSNIRSKSHLITWHYIDKFIHSIISEFSVNINIFYFIWRYIIILPLKIGHTYMFVNDFQYYVCTFDTRYINVHVVYR